MHVHIHHHNHNDQAIEQKLDRILKLLTKNQEIIMADLSQLTADVTADTNAVTAAVALINGLAAQITAAGTDPVKLKALTDQLEANNAALAAAITANTPADPNAPAGLKS